MGSLRADALTVGRFFIERRERSIGTLRLSSQRKLTAALVLGSLLVAFTLQPRIARAAGQPASSVTGLPPAPEPPPAAAGTNSSPAPAPVSPFTGGADGPATAPLPPPPPPAGPASGGALPTPPPPKGVASAPP